MSAGHIVAMGGGGFSMEPENPLLDDFVLSLTGRSLPKVCFVSTASAESPFYILKFYRAFSGRATPTDLTIFDPPSLPRQPSLTTGLPAYLAEQDVIYVGGGNTANLLAIWRMHGLDQALREVWMRGGILCGVSAGMICWFSGGLTDSFGGLEALPDGLGFLSGTACPHYDGETDRRSIYHRVITEGLPGGYAADDGAALHFHGRDLVEVVSSRPNARAYRVELIDGRVVETPLAARYLGDSESAHQDGREQH